MFAASCFSSKSLSQILKRLFQTGHIDIFSLSLCHFYHTFSKKLAFTAKKISAFLRETFLT